tara:strand:- start:1782 stop:2576 length:795 start_codon:yes stop_codon:yes gene_type:complete
MKILQYNVFGVPFASVTIAERHREICRQLQLKMNDLDIIVLCEVFTPHSRDLFTRFFKKRRWHSQRSPASGSPFALSGGLLVASKHPFVVRSSGARSHHETFTACSFVDCLAYKGFLDVKIDYQPAAASPTAASTSIHMIATHMQDSEWDKSGVVRKRQIDAIAGAIDRSSAEPTIIIGDFNIVPRPSKTKVFRRARLKLGPFYTVPTNQRGEPTSTHTDGTLDYCFYRNVRAIKCVATPMFDDSRKKPLSDHKAVETTFHFVK